MSWRNEALKVPGLENALSSCESGKRITEKANESLEKKRSDTASKLASLKRMYQAKNVLVSSATNPISTGAGTTGQHGISAESLFEFTAENCSRYRNERIVLEKFIKDASQPLQ